MLGVVSVVIRAGAAARPVCLLRRLLLQERDRSLEGRQLRDEPKQQFGMGGHPVCTYQCVDAARVYQVSAGLQAACLTRSLLHMERPEYEVITMHFTHVAGISHVHFVAHIMRIWRMSNLEAGAAVPVAARVEASQVLQAAVQVRHPRLQ